MMDVCLLGTGGVMPLRNRWLASLLVRVNGKMILIDCGEGTQVPLKETGWGLKAIGAVLFTHYHADHIAGLPGFLLTLGNSGRTEPLVLAGPPGLKTVVAGLTVICPQLPFPVYLMELSKENMSEFELEGITIRSMPVEHMMPCLAWCLEIKRQGKFDAEKARRLQIPIKYWKMLQRGESVYHEGHAFQPTMVLGPARMGIKVCYCTDSRPADRLAGFIDKADLFVCEGMYGDEADQPKALEKKHMTFSEAAALARKGNVKELWLTHFSPSMERPEDYLKNAAEIFPAVKISRDLMMKTFIFQDETTHA